MKMLPDEYWYIFFAALGATNITIIIVVFVICCIVCAKRRSPAEYDQEGARLISEEEQQGIVNNGYQSTCNTRAKQETTSSQLASTSLEDKITLATHATNQDNARRSDELESQLTLANEDPKKDVQLLKERIENIARTRICILGTDTQKLHFISKALLNFKISREFPSKVLIQEKKLERLIEVYEDDFEDSNMLILTLEADGSLPGNVYKKACELKKEVFFVYMNTSYEEKLKEGQGYHPFLKDKFHDKGDVLILMDNAKFISVKYKEDDLKKSHRLNKTQDRMIVRWINECINKEEDI